MQSSRVRLMLVALLGVFAFSAVAAAAAQASKKRRSGVSKEQGSRPAKRTFITGKSYTETSLSTGSGCDPPKCPNGDTNRKRGVLLGSNAGEPGTNDEVIEFGGGCTVRR